MSPIDFNDPYSLYTDPAYGDVDNEPEPATSVPSSASGDAGTLIDTPLISTPNPFLGEGNYVLGEAPTYQTQGGFAGWDGFASPIPQQQAPSGSNLLSSIIGSLLNKKPATSVGKTPTGTNAQTASNQTTSIVIIGILALVGLAIIFRR